MPRMHDVYRDKTSALPFLMARVGRENLALRRPGPLISFVDTATLLDRPSGDLNFQYKFSAGKSRVSESIMGDTMTITGLLLGKSLAIRTSLFAASTDEISIFKRHVYYLCSRSLPVWTKGRIK